MHYNSLKGNNISDEGAMAISPALKKMANLEALE